MSRNGSPAPRLPLPEGDVRPTFRRERRAINRGIAPVAGCDEAGRGPLAGPVVAAAVILDPARIPRGLDDSKKLTPEAREKLYWKICASARGARAADPAAPGLRRRLRSHRGFLRLPSGDRRRRARRLDRRGLDRRPGHPPPAHGAARAGASWLWLRAKHGL